MKCQVLAVFLLIISVCNIVDSRDNLSSLSKKSSYKTAKDIGFRGSDQEYSYYAMVYLNGYYGSYGALIDEQWVLAESKFNKSKDDVKIALTGYVYWINWSNVTSDAKYDVEEIHNHPFVKNIYLFKLSKKATAKYIALPGRKLLTKSLENIEVLIFNDGAATYRIIVSKSDERCPDGTDSTICLKGASDGCPHERIIVYRDSDSGHILLGLTVGGGEYTPGENVAYYLDWINTITGIPIKP